MLYAAILRSPLAHGRTRVLDKGPALAIPGVHAALRPGLQSGGTARFDRERL
jgi:CO/xanthine dehydrogenase Mo-binding subunit